MPNIITGSRIVFSVALLFCPALSPVFFALYFAAGLSDVLDGFVARKTNAVSAFGAKLDTVSDFVFVAVCLIKLLPVMCLPCWICVWMAVIALIKIVNVVSGFVIQKKFVAAHTVMNKITGGLLFVLPLTVSVADPKYTAAAVCAVASFAAVQEGHFIRTGRAV